MAGEITQADLQNAKTDATTIAVFANGNADNVNPGQAVGTVTNRDGETFPVLQKLVADFTGVIADQEIQENAAGASATLAGHYANDDTDIDVPGGAAGARGAKYWNAQAAIKAAAAAASAEAAANAAGVTIYGLGAPDAITVGANGATYIDTSSGRQYGPKAGGVWPKRFVEPRNVGPSYQPATMAFFMGQSNADGTSADPLNTTALTPGYGFEYYCDNGNFGSILPLGPYRLGKHTGGAQSAFAQTWAAGGGGACIVVDCAVGGSSMIASAKTARTGFGTIADLRGGTWDLVDSENHYNNSIRDHMKMALREAERLGWTIKKQVIYWSQGEQDALAGGNVTQAQYEAAFKRLLDRIHIDFPEIWVLIENLGTNSTGGPATVGNIRAAQVAVAADPLYAPWVKICSTLAKDFWNATPTPKFSDPDHYNQQGYNELGVEVATQGLGFTKTSGLYPLPTAEKHNDLLTNFPPVDGWRRMLWKTNRSGVWGMTGIFTDPNTPYAITLYDGAWIGKSDTRQSPTWTYPDATEKSIWILAHKSTGGSVSIALSANSSLTEIVTVDEGFPTDVMNIGTGLDATVKLSDAAFYRLNAADIRQLLLSSNSAQRPNVTISNATLGKLTGLTNLSLDRAPNAKPLDLTLTPLMINHQHNFAGLSVAEVNARLIALDANGLTGGTVSLRQFLASVHPASPPSGAGLAAKNNLLAKVPPWGVTTD